MIPPLLHQTAKSAQINPKWAPLQKRLLELHPGWEYRLWDDEANLALIRERRPDLEALYLGFPRPILRADLIRYVFLEQFGGVYLDTDYQMLKPFDLVDAPLVLPRESDDGTPVYLGNSFLASVPGHPFWTALIEAIRTEFSGAVDTEEQVLSLTGPGMVTRVWAEGFANDSSILLPPRRWFNPPVPEDDGALAAIESDPEAYGIHWCYGSWRALTPWSRLLNRVKRLFRR